MPDHASAPALRVDVLGPFRATYSGEPVRVDTRKALAVLLLLVTALSDGTGRLGRDHLAALLWPESDEVRAKATLRRTLSVLVAATGSALVVDRSSVGLHPDAVESDIVRLRAAAGSEDAEELARATALVRGEFAAGFRLRDSDPFDSWIAEQATAVRRELGAVFERLVLARMRRGELHAGLADAARWLELDPLHEPAHRSVMRLLAWTGRRQDALDHYRRCVRVLADELGVAPVRATTAVHDAIVTGTLEPPGRVRPRRAPVSAQRVVPLVGRDGDLAALLGQAGRPGRLVLVTGEAGVGRSRLIEEFAAQTGDVVVVRAHEGEVALSFAPVTDLLREAVRRGPPLEPDVAAEVARVLPEALPIGRPAPAALDSLGARDRFFEAVLRVIAAADVRAVVVEDVYAAGPAAADLLGYLVHRLDRLRCPLVLTWRDPGLPARHPVRLALGAEGLGERTTQIRLARLDAADVAALVAESGVELDPATLFAETAGWPMLLAEAVRIGSVDVLSLPVRDLLAARLAEVSEETGQVLGALAVCGGSADVAMLRTTGGRSDVETVDAVDEALSAGLVREEGDGVAFTHDALRRVAYEQLSLVRRRLLHGRAAEAGASGTGSHARAGLIAHHWHEAGRDDLASDAAWRAAGAAAALYAHADALRHVQFVVALGGDRADVALAEGDALVALGRYEAALAAFERAASLAAREPAEVRARIERRSADVHARAGEWTAADAGLATALELMVGVDDPVLISRLLADRAVLAVRRKADGADRFVSAAQAVTGGDAGYVGDVAGLVALAAGDAVAAETAFVAALEAIGDLGLRTAVLNNLALAQAENGAVDRAVETARSALELGEQHGDRHRLAALHANLADRLHAAGRSDEALPHLTASAGLFAEVGATPLDRPEVWTLTSW